jgi:hypothetical protein
MKKLIMMLLMLLACAFIQAKNVNIIMNDGTLKQGEFLGQDDDSIFIKNGKGKAETIPVKDVKKAFDSESGTPLNAAPAETEKTAPKTKKTSAQSDARIQKHIEETAAVFKGQPQTIVQQPSVYTIPSQAAPQVKILGEKAVTLDRGTIQKKDPGVFVRTVPDYFGIGFCPYMNFNFLFSGDNVRLKQTLRTWAVDSGGYTYDDGTFMISDGMNLEFFIRPVDWFAFGGFYGLAPSNQNMSVYRGGEKFMYIDMPITDYGVLLKFIPYSTADIKQDGSLVETFAFGLNFKIGSASLGSIFSNASIYDQASLTVSDLTAAPAPYFAAELSFSTQEGNMEFVLGYQSCMFTDISSEKAFAGITGPGNFLADTQGNIPFSAQGLYLSLQVLFN